MKNCPRCNANLDDNAMFCTTCGLQFANPQEQPAQNTYTQPNPAAAYPVAATVNPYDHTAENSAVWSYGFTAEFSAEDVAENKLYAMLLYLTSVIGVIIALLVQKNKDSAYLSFHIKQTLKIVIVQTLLSLATVVLYWTCIAGIAGGVCLIITLVVQFICFFKTSANKSIEAPIIRSLGFLK